MAPNEFCLWALACLVYRPFCTVLTIFPSRCTDAALHWRTWLLPFVPMSTEYLLKSWQSPWWYLAVWSYHPCAVGCNQLVSVTTMISMSICLDLIMVSKECLLCFISSWVRSWMLLEICHILFFDETVVSECRTGCYLNPWVLRSSLWYGTRYPRFSIKCKIRI